MIIIILNNISLLEFGTCAAVVVVPGRQSLEYIVRHCSPHTHSAAGRRRCNVSDPVSSLKLGRHHLAVETRGHMWQLTRSSPGLHPSQSSWSHSSRDTGVSLNESKFFPQRPAHDWRSALSLAHSLSSLGHFSGSGLLEKYRQALTSTVQGESFFERPLLLFNGRYLQQFIW